MDVQGVATLPCLDRAVEVAGAVLGPPLEFQDVHVTVLLELQDSRMKEAGDADMSADKRTFCTHTDAGAAQILVSRRSENPRMNAWTHESDTVGRESICIGRGNGWCLNDHIHFFPFGLFDKGQ